MGDKWKTIGRAIGRPLEGTLKTTGSNWKLWGTTGRPLGDKVAMPRTLPKEIKIGRRTVRLKVRHRARDNLGVKLGDK